MKKMRFSILFLIPIFVSSQANLESLGFNYSALVRDTAGRVQPSKQVKLRFTLLVGQIGTSETSPWIETQNVTTDAFGFVNVTIGNGTKQSGSQAASFADVDFTVTNYWILIEVFNNFTNSYDPLAKQAFQAVPYAKVAGTVSGNSGLLSGAIVAFGGDSAHIPKGWLLCDGRELDATDSRYINLFKAIGYNWGTSDNATKFNIPDTRGLFLRGVNNGSGNDPDVADRTNNKGGNTGDKVGSYQVDEIKTHTHDFSAVRYRGGNGNISESGTGSYLNLGGTTTSSGGNETRPKNVYVNYIIKL